jgi:biotin operon repressor
MNDLIGRLEAMKKDTGALIIEAVQKYQSKNYGNAPSYDEIAEDVGRGRTTVRYHVNRLLKQGLLIITGVRRAIAVPAQRATPDALVNLRLKNGCPLENEPQGNRQHQKMD